MLPVMFSCSTADVGSLVFQALYEPLLEEAAAIILAFISILSQQDFRVSSHRHCKPLVVSQRSVKTHRKHVNNYFQ